MIDKQDLRLIPKQPGIYFLYKKSIKNKDIKLCYIGKSSNLHARISVHKSLNSMLRNSCKNKGCFVGIFVPESVKLFDCVRFMLCDKLYLEEYEGYFIDEYRPALNYFYEDLRCFTETELERYYQWLIFNDEDISDLKEKYKGYNVSFHYN